MAYIIKQFGTIEEGLAWANHVPSCYMVSDIVEEMMGAYGFDLRKLYGHISGIKGRQLSDGRRHVVFLVVGVGAEPVTVMMTGVMGIESLDSMWTLREIFSRLAA